MGSSNTPETEDDGNPRRIAPGESLAEAALLINRQRTVQADWGQVQAFLGQLYSRVARSSFSVCLLSDRSIRRYNRRFRLQDKATDVLAFPAGDQAGESQSYLGDILISVETARDNAARYGLKLEEEIKLLALHGVLHLMGYDHENDGGRMARQERLWCARLGLAGSLTARAPKPRSPRIALGGRQR